MRQRKSERDREGKKQRQRQRQTEKQRVCVSVCVCVCASARKDALQARQPALHRYSSNATQRRSTTLDTHQHSQSRPELLPSEANSLNAHAALKSLASPTARGRRRNVRHLKLLASTLLLGVSVRALLLRTPLLLLRLALLMRSVDSALLPRMLAPCVRVGPRLQLRLLLGALRVVRPVLALRSGTPSGTRTTGRARRIVNAPATAGATCACRGAG